MPAVGTTALQALNKVLIRMRESTVANFSSLTANQQMFLDMLNTVKTEVENAWMWDALRDTYEVAAVPGTVSYAFTGAGAGARIIDAWNETNGNQLCAGTYMDFNQRYFGGLPVSTGIVSEYITNTVNASYDLKVDVWPSPGSTQTLNFNLYVPQADLSATTDVMRVPPNVVIEGTIAYLMAERNDEGADKQMARYQRLLADAVAADASRHSEELDWVPV